MKAFFRTATCLTVPCCPTKEADRKLKTTKTKNNNKRIWDWIHMNNLGLKKMVKNQAGTHLPESSKTSQFKPPMLTSQERNTRPFPTTSIASNGRKPILWSMITLVCKEQNWMLIRWQHLVHDAEERQCFPLDQFCPHVSKLNWHGRDSVLWVGTERSDHMTANKWNRNTYKALLSWNLALQKHYSLLLQGPFWTTAFVCRNEKSELCLHIAASCKAKNDYFFK